jgi:hypothetical protein
MIPPHSVLYICVCVCVCCERSRAASSSRGATAVSITLLDSLCFVVWSVFFCLIFLIFFFLLCSTFFLLFSSFFLPFFFFYFTLCLFLETPPPPHLSLPHLSITHCYQKRSSIHCIQYGGQLLGFDTTHPLDFYTRPAGRYAHPTAARESGTVRQIPLA